MKPKIKLDRSCGVVKLLMIAACTAMQSGCAYAPVYYNAAGMPKEQLAYVEAELRGTLAANMSAVYDSNGKLIFGNNSLVKRNLWDKLYLQPDRYHIVVYCNDGFVLIGYPTIDLTLIPGAKYKLRCRHHKDGTPNGYFDVAVNSTI